MGQQEARIVVDTHLVMRYNALTKFISGPSAMSDMYIGADNGTRACAIENAVCSSLEQFSTSSSLMV
jgi:hypothetical protein